MMRSSVVLPEPEGPSSATSSPESTRRSTWSTAAKAPKRRRDVANFDGHDGLVPGRGYDSRSRQATRLFSTSVTTASSVSTEATANAAANSYSW